MTLLTNETQIVTLMKVTRLTESEAEKPSRTLEMFLHFAPEIVSGVKQGVAQPEHWKTSARLWIIP